MIVTYNKCRECGRKGSCAEDNRGQVVLQDRKFWCGYQGKRKGRAAQCYATREFSAEM